MVEVGRRLGTNDEHDGEDERKEQRDEEIAQRSEGGVDGKGRSLSEDVGRSREEREVPETGEIGPESGKESQNNQAACDDLGARNADDDGNRMALAFAIAVDILHILDDLAQEGEKKSEECEERHGAVDDLTDGSLAEEFAEMVGACEPGMVCDGDEQGQQGGAERDNEIAEQENALVGRRIEPEESGAHEEDEAHGDGSEKESGGESEEYAESGGDMMDACRLIFGYGVTDNEGVGVIDQVDLGVEIVVDDVASGGYEQGGKKEQEKNAGRHEGRQFGAVESEGCEQGGHDAAVHEYHEQRHEEEIDRSDEFQVVHGF